MRGVVRLRSRRVLTPRRDNRMSQDVLGQNLRKARVLRSHGSHVLYPGPAKSRAVKGPTKTRALERV